MLLSSSHSMTKSSLGAYPNTTRLNAPIKSSFVSTDPFPPITIDTVRSISRPRPYRPALDMLRSVRAQVRGRVSLSSLCSEGGEEEPLVVVSLLVLSGK